MAQDPNYNTQNPAPTKTQRSFWSKAHSIGGYGFIGFDAYSRMKEGDSAPMAIGKAVGANALWGLVPGGMASMAALAVVQAAPQIATMTDAQKGMVRQFGQSFGGGFTQNSGQEYMKQMGLSNAISARQNASSIMSRHARGASKSY